MRARTRPGRLAALDAWLCHCERELLARGPAIIDVGFGERAITTEELARAVRAVNPALRVLGVERDPSRVAPHAEVELVHGELPALAALGPACVVRAMNVLRSYREDEVPAMHAALGAPLVEGGLVLEGSTDTEGHVTVAHLLRRRGEGLEREGLLFHTDFSRGFSPWLFRDWLPRDLRRRVKPGEPIFALLDAWSRAVEAQGSGRAPEERFRASVTGVGTLSASPWELAHGFARAQLSN